MPTSAARAATEPRLAFNEVLSDDGTRLRGLDQRPRRLIDGPTVVLCNGLGTSPWAWPALLDPDCGVRVVSWNHRGTGGSERPSDPEHVGIEAFVEDALSVMDHFGVDRAVLMGWSMGVNTMFELAVHHPERVTRAVRGGRGPRRHLRHHARPAAPARGVAAQDAHRRAVARVLKLRRPGAHPGHDPAAGRAAHDRRADAHRLHVPGARPRARRGGDPGVPDDAGRVVLPPRAAHLEARRGSR